MNERKGFFNVYSQSIRGCSFTSKMYAAVFVSTKLTDLLFFFCSMLGSVNLTSVSVKGVAAALEKHTPKGESKGIKAFFRLDENGILNLEKVHYMYYSFL